jgi:hypothetical protein
MRKFGWILALAALSVAAGCGGNGTSSFATLGTSSSSSSSSSSGGPAANVAAISVVTSLPQIPSNGSTNATITAFVRDANNQFLSGIPVSFSTTSGGFTAPTSVTDANGQATAMLGTAGDQTNRTITITAAAGTQSATVDVGVVGTAVSLSGPASLIQGATGTYTVSVTDSAGAAIGNQTVAVASGAGNTLSAASLTTDTSGHATFTLTGTTAGNDTLTATVLGQSAQTLVSISNQSFAFTTPAAGALIALGASPTTVTLVWATAGVPQAGKTITFSTTRGTFNGVANATTATAVTNGTGTATATIAATTGGPAIITASSTGVSAQLAVTFVATNPHTIDVQASPGTVVTQGQSTITAIVRDPSNNLVQGQTVSFQLTDVTGGSLSVGSALTDAQGKAQTVYTASTSPSATDGVTITASIPAVPAVPAATATLTVGGQTVFLSLGTGEVIGENADKTQFLLPFVVQAQDSGGNAVNGVNITLNVHSLEYGKGAYVIFNSAWVQTGQPGSAPFSTAPPGITVCENEDVNGNGILDAGEDFNNDGRLWPGNVAAVSPGTVTTAATTITNGTSTTTVNGSAALTVTYPEDHAQWVRVVLTASTTVSGTESSTTSTFWLPILATYLTSTTSSPPGAISPYGTNTSCANPN